MSLRASWHTRTAPVPKVTPTGSLVPCGWLSTLAQMRRFLDGSGGQSLVETSLTLPILVLSLVAGADMARAYALQIAVQNGARAGAEATALDATPTSVEAKAHVRQEMDRTPGMDSAQANITLTFTQADGTTACTGAPNTSTPGTPSIATPCYANVQVQYTFRTITPWPLMPNIFTFDRMTRVRRY